MTIKEFDCVEMKHAATERIQKKLSGKSLMEKIEFWKKRYDDLIDRQASAQKIKK